MNPAPVALFVFDRPWHLSQTLDALRKNDLADQTELFVFADGPRDTDESRAAVTEVGKCLENIEGFEKVTVIKSEKNKGLAESIINGVTKVVDRFGRVIILEDDLVTGPGFLRYMNEALVRYQDDEQVMQISGYMFDVNIHAETDAMFLPFTTSWGWATWKRAWAHFDPLMNGYIKLTQDRRLRKTFNLDGAYDYYSLLKAQRRGKVDSWAIRWYLSFFMMGGLTLFPVESFIKNIGFDGSGTHCGIRMPSPPNNLSNFKHNYQQLNMPKDIVIQYEVFKEIKFYLCSQRGLTVRLRRFFKKFVLRI